MKIVVPGDTKFKVSALKVPWAEVVVAELTVTAPKEVKAVNPPTLREKEISPVPADKLKSNVPFKVLLKLIEPIPALVSIATLPVSVVGDR